MKCNDKKKSFIKIHISIIPMTKFQGVGIWVILHNLS
jgi:hypothetical protein